MKSGKKTIKLDQQGIDTAAETIQGWLTDAGVKRKDVLRIRLTMEELLGRVCEHTEGSTSAELSMSKRFGVCRLRIRYGGDRFDPGEQKDNELEELSAGILARTGFLPSWRWHGGENELRLKIQAGGLRTEYVLLGCIVAAVLVGLLGSRIPADS